MLGFHVTRKISNPFLCSIVELGTFHVCEPYSLWDPVWLFFVFFFFVLYIFVMIRNFGKCIVAIQLDGG